MAKLLKKGENIELLFIEAYSEQYKPIKYDIIKEYSKGKFDFQIVFDDPNKVSNF